MRDSLILNIQGLEFLPYDSTRHTPVQVLYQKPQTLFLRELEGLESHPPSRDGSALTAAMKSLAVDGTTISFSAISWDVR